MKDKIFDMNVKDVIGMKVVFKSKTSGRKRIGRIYGVYGGRLNVLDNYSCVLNIDYDEILEIVDLHSAKG